jgi:hypothetical protein
VVWGCRHAQRTRFTGIRRRRGMRERAARRRGHGTGRHVGRTREVAIVAEWAIDDADASAPPAHPWTARPCMKNNPQRTAPTATRRAVARAETALPVTVSPVAVPSARCGPRYSREPDIRQLVGTGSGGVSSNLLRKTARFRRRPHGAGGREVAVPTARDGGGRYAGHRDSRDPGDYSSHRWIPP